MNPALNFETNVSFLLCNHQRKTDRGFNAEALWPLGFSQKSPGNIDKAILYPFATGNPLAAFPISILAKIGDVVKIIHFLFPIPPPRLSRKNKLINALGLKG